MATATSKAANCTQLVQIENEVDEYRRNGINKLQQRNVELIKWIGITLYNTLYVPNREDLRVLHDTSTFLHSIYERLDKEDVAIFEQRKRFE